MKRILTFFILTFFSTLVFSQDCKLEVKKDDIIQISEGFGSDRSTALEDAKRNAINEAVGSYIQNETKIDGDNIDYDRIQEFGKGLVRDYCVISQGQDGHEITVIIEAVVAKEMVYQTLKQSGIEIELNTKQVGENLIQEIILEENETDNVRRILKKIDSGDPFVYELKESGFGRIKTKVGSQETLDKTSGVIQLNIAVQPNFGNYLKTLENSLRNISLDSYNDQMVVSINKKEMIYFPFQEENDKKSSNWQSNKLIFINKIYSSFESDDLSKFYKRDEITRKGKTKKKSIKGKGRKEKFLKMFNGQNYHVNASIMSFLDPTLVTEIKTHIDDINGDYFKIKIIKKNSSELVDEYYGYYNYISGRITIDGLVSSEKLPVEREKSDNISILREEYQNYNNLVAKSLTSRNQIRYLSNVKGSYRKEAFISSLSALASTVPFIFANNKYNSWNNSVTPHGFGSDYNPHQTLYDVSLITSIAAVVVFGSWRLSLTKRPFAVLRANNKEDVSIFCSDTDFIRSPIELNAYKSGLIDRNHEVYDWSILNDKKSNTISVFYTEIPVGLNDMSDDFKAEIKSISYEEYNSRKDY